MPQAFRSTWVLTTDGLKPATDRILGTSATIEWEHASPGDGFCAGACTALLKQFAAHENFDEPHGTIGATIEC